MVKMKVIPPTYPNDPEYAFQDKVADLRESEGIEDISLVPLDTTIDDNTVELVDDMVKDAGECHPPVQALTNEMFKQGKIVVHLSEKDKAAVEYAANNLKCPKCGSQCLDLMPDDNWWYCRSCLYVNPEFQAQESEA